MWLMPVSNRLGAWGFKTLKHSSKDILDVFDARIRDGMKNEIE